MTDTETTPEPTYTPATHAPAVPSADRSPPRAIFVAAILAGSFLLFLVQPMVARMALPRLGGAPAVWNSAMLVYQALLLGGYAYAHWLGRLPARTQGRVHLALLLLAALWLPIGIWEMHLPARAEPALWVPWLFGASIGPLFLVIAAQSPLLQRWYSVASGGRDPYALYVASNLGSFAGLVAYPLIVEPMMALRAQSWLWSAGYVVVLLLVAACALRLPRLAGDAAPTTLHSPAPGWKRVGHWLLLAFVPSGLMLATSTYITTDIVAVPLLWVLPLGLYLLSFTIAFANNRTPAEIVDRFAPVVVLMFGGMMISGNQDYPYVNALMALVLLFVVATSLHGRMYASRPEPDRLTGFYLAMSLGGALGGVFAGLIAPVLFDWTYEYPILILAAGYLVPQAFLLPLTRRLWAGNEQAVRIKALSFALVILTLACLSIYNPGHWLGDRNTNLGFIMIALVGLLAVGMRLPFTIALAAALLVFGGLGSIQLSLVDARTRSYFGVYTVSDFADQRRLAHGTTLHGLQLKGPGAMMPTTYYAPLSGIGFAMRAAPGLYGRQARIGVVGLGTGTLSCYAIPGQRWRFYEIDPAVVRLARDSGKFTFLEKCLPNPDIVLGDARLSLAEAAPASLDLLALDAFSSDAVPMHLMTKEAFDTYGRILPQQGLLLVHVSNRFLTLEPVVAAAAAQGGWHAAKLVYHPNMPERMQEATVSDWIALSRDPRTLTKLQSGGGDWMPLRSYPRFTAWSDDYATIVPVLRGTPWAPPSD